MLYCEVQVLVFHALGAAGSKAQHTIEAAVVNPTKAGPLIEAAVHQTPRSLLAPVQLSMLTIRAIEQSHNLLCRHQVRLSPRGHHHKNALSMPAMQASEQWQRQRFLCGKRLNDR